MNTDVMLNEQTISLTTNYLSRNEIRSITVKRGSGITKSTEISNIDIIFIKDKNDISLDYSVKFKLQTDCADIFHYVIAINTSPVFNIELTEESKAISADIVNEKVLSLIDIIRDRVKSAQKEQKVQNISYVGNTFVLNNSTKFKVLSDDGEGRLNIEILTRDLPMDALLTASGLLDGLYLGSIKLADS